MRLTNLTRICRRWRDGSDRAHRPGRRLEETLGFLEQHKLAFVAVDEPQGFETTLPPIAAVATPIAIVRFHGRNAETWEARGRTSAQRFDYWYTDEEFQEWLPRIEEMAERATEVHLLMNTNNRSQGPDNARLLREVLLQGRLL